MKDFKELLKEYYELGQAYDNSEIQYVYTVEELSSKEVQLFCDALNDIYESVKLPGNRSLILQEVTNGYDGGIEKGVELKGSHNVWSLLKMRAILAGVIQNVEYAELYDFAREGDSGYSDLKLRMVKHVVKREREGIDYQEDKEEIGLDK